MVKFETELSVIEQHAEQLRAEVLDYLHAQGEEYAMTVSDIIAGIMEEDSPHKQLLGKLAEIGLCDVFTRAGRTIEEDNA